MYRRFLVESSFPFKLIPYVCNININLIFYSITIIEKKKMNLYYLFRLTILIAPNYLIRS